MRWWLALGVLLGGCAGAPASPDASVGDAGPVIEPPAAPTPAESPRFVCPNGWRAAADGSTTLCEPWTGEAAPHCGPTEIASVGGASDCRPAGPCPSGEWPDDLPPDAVFVRAGATGGDGSRASPLGTLTLGLARAGATGTVVLGAGDYSEWTRLSGTPSIVGVCPERVHIVDPATTPQAPLLVEAGAHPTIRGVTLRGASHALWLLAGASATIEGVVLDAPQPLLLEADAAIDADSTRIASSSSSRSAVLLFPRARATFAASHVSGGDAAIRATPERGTTGAGEATLALTDTAILDTGVALYGGVGGTLERVVFERLGSGAIVFPGRELSLTDVRAREVGDDTGFLGVFGLAHLRRVAVTDVHDTRAPAAVIAVGRLDGGPVRLDGSDLHVARAANFALSVGDSDGVTLDHVSFDDVTGGFDLRGSSTSLTDARITTHGPAVPDVDRPGSAIQIAGGTLLVERASLEVTAGERVVGLLVRAPAVVTARDLSSTGGIGVAADCVASCDVSIPSLTLERVRVAGVAELGLEAYATGIHASDVVVDGVAYEGGAVPAFGVVAAEDGVVDLARVSVRGVEGAAVASLERGLVRGAGIDVQGAVAIVRSGDAARHYGDGLVCGSGGRMQLDAVEVQDAERAGLVVSFDCDASRWTGAIRRCAIGVLTDEQPAASIDFSGIVLEGNGVPYDSLTLEIPVVDPSF